jgi:ubiquinone/menaquinone biosynthesis C-methylase UbiE
MAGHLAPLGHVVFGVERDGSMLHRAVDKGVRARFVRGDISRLPIRTFGADVATCALALTHVSDLDDAFAALARVVRPGGAVVVSDIHPFAVATGARLLQATRWLSGCRAQRAPLAERAFQGRARCGARR